MSRPNAAHAHKAPIPGTRPLALKTISRAKEKPRCIAKALSGQRCQSAPMRGKKKCLFHIGNNARELGAKGGRRRAIYNPENLEPFTAPQTAEDVVRLLSHTLVETRAGKLDPKVASTIAQLANAYMQSLDVAAFEQRLAKLEEKTADKPLLQ